MGHQRDWERYAVALNLHLEGASLPQIAKQFGVTKARAGQMVQLAKMQLAYRVFRGLPRPHVNWTTGLTETKLIRKRERLHAQAP